MPAAPVQVQVQGAILPSSRTNLLTSLMLPTLQLYKKSLCQSSLIACIISEAMLRYSRACHRIGGHLRTKPMHGYDCPSNAAESPFGNKMLGSMQACETGQHPTAAIHEDTRPRLKRLLWHSGNQGPKRLLSNVVCRRNHGKLAVECRRQGCNGFQRAYSLCMPQDTQVVKAQSSSSKPTTLSILLIAYF